MKLSTTNKVLIGVGVILLAALTVSIVRRKNDGKSGKKPRKILLLGGLDTRKGDKDITTQSKLLKEGTGGTMEVDGFRYKDLNGIVAAIEQDPNTFVVLFSAGCQHASKVAESIKEHGGDLNRLFIVEPYNGSTTIKAVKKAVEMGVPAKNVIAGSYAQVGKGMIDGSTPTPKCTPSHWCALSEVGKMIAK